MEVVHARCAGMDISKKDARVCVRIAGAGRRKTTETVTTWGSMTSQILALRDHLIAQQVTCVVLEATGDYWKPFYYLLEDICGAEIMLVNARHVKNLPGRKTDLLTEHSGVPAGHSPGEPLPLTLLTCPGPYLRGHKGTEAGCANTGSGNTGLNHPPAFSSLLLVTPATNGPPSYQHCP